MNSVKVIRATKTHLWELKCTILTTIPGFRARTRHCVAKLGLPTLFMNLKAFAVA
jgi:hypothetical protein